MCNMLVECLHTRIYQIIRICAQRYGILTKVVNNNNNNTRSAVALFLNCVRPGKNKKRQTLLAVRDSQKYALSIRD